MNEVVVKTENLCKSFKRKSVLRGMNLKVSRGSIYGFLGENGAGKTTTIKCLLGLYFPTSGRAEIWGHDSAALPEPVKACIGYIAQEHDLFPWMRVAQIVRYTRAFYERWNDNLTEHLLKKFELPGNDIVGKLSVGQAQRLAIVLTLAFEPDIFILDEPAALDPAARRDFLETILEVIQDGKRTILLSSHITSDVERVADTIGLLKDGLIQVEKPIEELRESVKKLRLTLEEGSRMPPDLQIEGALRTVAERDSALITVKDYSPAMKAQIAERWKVKVEVLDVNLEEVFLSYHPHPSPPPLP